MPLPLKVPPFKVIDPPELGDGLLPRGKEQSEPTVLVPLVCVKVTRLNVLLPQARVAVPPLKFTVPPLALNVELLSRVKLEAKEAVPDGAVKLAPELIVKVLAKVTVPEVALKVAPLLTVKAPLKAAPLGAVTVPAV